MTIHTRGMIAGTIHVIQPDKYFRGRTSIALGGGKELSITGTGKAVQANLLRLAAERGR